MRRQRRCQNCRHRALRLPQPDQQRGRIPRYLPRGVRCARRAITENMKIAAAYAIASLVSDAELKPEYILPHAFDPRIKDTVVAAVAEVARKDGVARI